MQPHEIDTIVNYVSDLTKFQSIGIKSIRNNIIVHLSYELAPRVSQFYKLNIDDFIVVKNEEKSYYSINLPMSKKRKIMELKKRRRSISDKLGQKIESLIKRYEDLNIKSESLFPSHIDTGSLFPTKNNTRLTPNEFTQIIINELLELGINRTPTDLRHHLAQSLADQGSPAEVIM